MPDSRVGARNRKMKNIALTLRKPKITFIL